MDAPRARFIDELRATVGRRIGAMGECYEHALRRDATLEGRVTIQFTVGSDGQMTSISTANDTIGSEVSNCIVGLFQEMLLPAPPGGEETFSYPFFFRPRR
jgi:hypothetical protein